MDEVMTRLTTDALRDADLGICTLADG